MKYIDDATWIRLVQGFYHPQLEEDLKDKLRDKIWAKLDFLCSEIYEHVEDYDLYSGEF